MELYLDTADIKAITRLNRIFPLSGVTTNPSIIAKEKRPIFELLTEIQDIIGTQGQLFAQTMAKSTEGMVEEAQKLREHINSIIVKIPTTPEGVAAIKILTAQNIPTLGTAVYGAGQGVLAGLAGAKYIAPYVNRIDAQGGNGIDAVAELQHLVERHLPESKVMAASFRTPRQVLDCLLAGCQSVTVPVDVLELFLADPAVDAAMAKFEQDWSEAFSSDKI